MTTTQAATLRGVTKQYPKFALGPIDLALPAGSIVGLIGENGAGKTTLLKLLSGVNRPDSGEITLLGSTPDDPAARARIGVVYEESFFYMGLTLARIGRSMAGMYGSAWDAKLYAQLLERFQLDPKQKLKDFSRGMRMKARLATAMAHRPDLLILDEATSGLDPVVRGELLDLLLEFIQDERHTVLMSSHITADLEQVADSIACLHGGKLLFHENKDELLQHYGLLRCPDEDLRRLDRAAIVYTRKGAFGSETLVSDRAAVAAALPHAVCDAAGLDDIMRFYSGRDAQ